MPKPNAVPHRRALCVELIELRRDHAAVYAREEAIKAELKKIAADSGASFKEEIVAQGSVSVSRPKKGEFKGTFPTLQIEPWQALKPARQHKLVEDGLIANIDQYGGDFYGSVTVKLF